MDEADDERVLDELEDELEEEFECPLALFFRDVERTEVAKLVRVVEMLLWLLLRFCKYSALDLVFKLM